MSQAPTSANPDGGWADGHGHASEHRRESPTAALQDDISSCDADAAMRKAIAQAVGHLQARYPTAPSSLVQDCVHQAFNRLRNARITLYLAILIERSAGRAMADALRSGDVDR